MSFLMINFEYKILVYISNHCHNKSVYNIYGMIMTDYDGIHKF